MVTYDAPVVGFTKLHLNIRDAATTVEGFYICLVFFYFFLFFSKKNTYFYTVFILVFMIADLSYLQQMTGNEREMMNEMIELFLRQLTEMRGDFELLVSNKNWVELSRLAHKVKSSSLVMGIGEMTDNMKELELLAKEGKKTEKYPEYIARFNMLADQAEEELKAYLVGK